MKRLNAKCSLCATPTDIRDEHGFLCLLCLGIIYEALTTAKTDTPQKQKAAAARFQEVEGARRHQNQEGEAVQEVPGVEEVEAASEGGA